MARETPRSPREHHDDTHDTHDPLRPVAVTLNPLGFAVERYGMNVEILPASHHAIVASAYLQSTPVWLVKSIVGRDLITGEPGASPGGEIGYRLYSGSRGADGLFVGTSFVVMPLAYPRVADSLTSVELRRFTATGAALDIGAQKVTSSGFTVGAGIGVMALAYDLPADNHRIPIAFEPHVLPRVLLTTGWSL